MMITLPLSRSTTLLIIPGYYPKFGLEIFLIFGKSAFISYTWPYPNPGVEDQPSDSLEIPGVEDQIFDRLEIPGVEDQTSDSLEVPRVEDQT